MRQGIFCRCIIMCLILFGIGVAYAAQNKAVYYKEEFYYENEPMYLCSVVNTATHQTFYGQSPKQKYATIYARAACQMQSYKGQCFVRATCNWELVKVRKRRFVRP